MKTKRKNLKEEVTKEEEKKIDARKQESKDKISDEIKKKALMAKLDSIFLIEEDETEKDVD